MWAVALITSLWFAGPPTGVELDWTAPASCPTRSDVLARIETLLGPKAPDVSVHVTAHVEHDGSNGYTLELEMVIGDAAGARTLSSTDCKALARTAALVIAIAIDPQAAIAADPDPESDPASASESPSASDPASASASDPASASASDPASDPASASASESDPDPDPESASDPAPDPAPPRPRPRKLIGGGPFLLGFGGGLELGALPRPTGALTFTLGYVRNRLRLEARGLYAFPVEVLIRDEDQRGSVRTQLGTAALRACFQPKLSSRAPRVELPLCAGLEAGARRSNFIGVRPGTAVLDPWVGAIAGLGVRGKPHRLIALGLDLELSVPFLRTH